MKIKFNKSFFEKKKRVIFSLCYATATTYLLVPSTVNNLIDNITIAYYEEEYNVSNLSDLSFYNDYLFHDDSRKNLENMTITIVDLSKISSLSFLQYASELKKIEILNAQELKDTDIEFINNSSVKEIYLSFDQNAVLSKACSRMDLNKFQHKEYIYGAKMIDCKYPRKEISEIILTNYLLNIDGTHLDFSKYNDINQKLDEIIFNLDLTTKQNNPYNLAKIISYVINHISYDEDVIRYIHTDKWYTDISQWIKGLKLSYIYNIRPLSSVLTDIYTEDSGVCINYSSLFLILCYKANFSQVYMVYDETHAWNVISYMGNEYVIDLTYFDQNEGGILRLEEYINTNLIDNWNSVKDELLFSINDNRYRQSIHYPNSEQVFGYCHGNIYAYYDNQLKNIDQCLTEIRMLIIKWSILFGIGMLISRNYLSQDEINYKKMKKLL